MLSILTSAMVLLPAAVCFSPSHPELIKPVDGPVLLQAFDSLYGALDGEYIQAYDGYLHLGGLGAGKCLDSGGLPFSCLMSRTVFDSRGERLAAMAPGGQKLYTKSDGSIAFTPPIGTGIEMPPDTT